MTSRAETPRHHGALVLLLFAVGSVHATPIVVPPGLAPGSAYRLAFVTAGTRDATSSNIADYNQFVTDQANSSPQLQALGTVWYAIASTASVSAFTNIGSNFITPMYDLAGNRLAPDSYDLWNLGTPLENPLILDQYGDTRAVFTWTGTSYSGAADGPQGLQGLGSTIATVGNSSDTFYWVKNSVRLNITNLSFYGISGVLVAPTPTPEPSTIVMMTLALVLVSVCSQTGRLRRN